MGKLEDFEVAQYETLMQSRLGNENFEEFNIGDTVDVHVKIVEGGKTRVQIFTGTVIARNGTLNRETFTVRRIVAGEGVERVFPFLSPWIQSVVVRRPGKVRRAKLYYLRDRVGKATKVRERMIYEKKSTRKRAPVVQKAPEPPESENSEVDETAAVGSGAQKD